MVRYTNVMFQSSWLGVWQTCGGISVVRNFFLNLADEKYHLSRKQWKKVFEEESWIKPRNRLPLDFSFQKDGGKAVKERRKRSVE